ncbi:MAG: hypothetical protein KKG75_02140 [Nanoarchaeota archaeon]|nr:hypothetical protein [Nanoarchaeota archaeon]
MIKAIYSKHANDKRILYRFSKEQIETVIKRGATSKQTDGYLTAYKEIKVAYKKINKETYYIKTIYID